MEGEKLEIKTPKDASITDPSTPRVSLEGLFCGRTPEARRAEYAGAFDWDDDVGREIVPE